MPSDNTSLIHSPVELTPQSIDFQGLEAGSSLSAYLRSKGHKPMLSNGALELTHLSHLDLSGMSFKNMHFSGQANGLSVDKARFEQVTFDKVNLSQAIFNQTTFDKVEFSGVDLSQASFIDTEFHHAAFKDSHLSNASISASVIRDSMMSFVDMDNLFIHNSEQANLHVVFEQAYPDYVFQQAMEHPVCVKIGIVDDEEWHDTPFYLVQDHGHEAVTFSYDEKAYLEILKAHHVDPMDPSDVDNVPPPSPYDELTLREQATFIIEQYKDFFFELFGEPFFELLDFTSYGEALAWAKEELLDVGFDEMNLDTSFNYSGVWGRLHLEVRQALEQYNPSHEKSIAQALMESQTPVIQAIKASAIDYMSKVDALWLPGGADVHPDLYGQENIHSYPSDSYFREVLEIALVDAAIAADKPIIGVCHGSQLLNVYFGGTLHQHVQGQWGEFPLEVHSDKGILGSIMEPGAIGISMHHQAIDELGEGLELVASYDGIVKAVQTIDESPILLTQFHPEYLVDETSERIVDTFFGLGMQSAKEKTHTLVLEEILSQDSTIKGLDSESNSSWYHTIGDFAHSIHESLAQINLEPIPTSAYDWSAF